LPKVLWDNIWENIPEPYKGQGINREKNLKGELLRNLLRLIVVAK
jgi:hypothetical protein